MPATHFTQGGTEATKDWESHSGESIVVVS